MTQVTESDYKEAQNGDAKVRQEFCDAVDLEDASGNITKVLYEIPKEKPEKNEYGEFDLMSHHGEYTWESPTGKSVPGCMYIDTTIHVFPKAFEILSFEEFLSAKIDHEGVQQGGQFRKNSRKYNSIMRKYFAKEKHIGDYYQAIIELPAYANQLIRSERRGLSDKFKESLTEKIKRYVATLKQQDFSLFNEDLLRISCGTEGDKYIKEMLGLKMPWNWI